MTSDKKRFSVIWLGAALLAAAGVLPLLAADTGPGEDPLALAGERIAPTIVLVSTEAAGGSSPGASASPSLAVGGSGSAYVMTGFFDRSGRPVDETCTGGSGSGDGDREGKAPHVWQARFTVVEAAMDKIVLDVDWSRSDAEREGEGRKVKGDHRRLTLREGATHWLDLLDAPEAISRCPRNVLVGVKALVREDPAFADKRISYDMWLVDEGPDGRRLEAHRRLSAGMGERVKVDFDPLRWGLPGVLFPSGRPAQVVGDFSAEILGRLRPDGTLGLVLDLDRRLGVAPEGRPRRGGVGDSGRKRVRIGLGETVALVLPGPRGRDTEWDTGTGTTAGVVTSSPSVERLPESVTASDGRITVEFPKFFEGHTTKLLLTATAE